MPGFDEGGGERIDRKILPAWMPEVEQHAAEVVAELERAAQLRVAQGRATKTEAARAAAASVRRIKEGHERDRQQFKELDTTKRLSAAFEVLVADGMRGRPATAHDPNAFKPGYLAPLAEVIMTDDEQDLIEGIDVIVIIPTAEGEVRLGIDVTTGVEPLSDKFRKQREGVELGDPTASRSSKSLGSDVLRVIVGISSAPMHGAIREWGRSTNRKEVHEMPEIGARIREQVLAQLESLAAYAKECGQEALAKRYELALEQIRAYAKHAPKAIGLEQDLVHTEILKQARTLGKGGARAR